MGELCYGDAVLYHMSFKFWRLLWFPINFMAHLLSAAVYNSLNTGRVYQRNKSNNET